MEAVRIFDRMVLFMMLSRSFIFAAACLALPVFAQVRPLTLVAAGEPRSLPHRILGASASPFWEHLIDDPAKVAAIKSLRLAYTRFPGGSYANYYDWKTGLFSLEPRPDSSLYYRMFVRLSRMVARSFPGGIKFEQYKKFSDSAGAEIVLVPNLETSSVEDQKQWFQHMAAEGEVPTHIELGNEFWIAMGLDREVMRRWADEPSSMRVMKRYLDAFRPYLPKGAKVAVQAAAAPSFGEPYMRGPVMRRLRAWDAALKPEPWFDAVTVHLYPRLNEALGLPGAANEEITPNIAQRNLRVLMARVDEGTDRILEDIERRVPGKEIWVTEWSPRGAQPADISNRADPSTPAMMLQLMTRMTLAFLRDRQVTVSLFYALFLSPQGLFRAFVQESGGYQPVPATVALRWLNEAANGGASFQRYQETGNPRISGGGVRHESYGAVEGGLFRGRGGATLILQNVSGDSRVWKIPADLNLGTPSRIERMAMPDLADKTLRAARAETVEPSAEVPVPPYSVTRVVWSTR
jgi:hypothetical protein